MRCGEHWEDRNLSAHVLNANVKRKSSQTERVWSVLSIPQSAHNTLACYHSITESCGAVERSASAKGRGIILVTLDWIFSTQMRTVRVAGWLPTPLLVNHYLITDFTVGYSKPAIKLGL